MSDIGDDYKALREHRRAERDRVVPGRVLAIRALAIAGYRVRELTPFQFRINGKLDLFPVNRRWHFLPTNSRGWYDTPDRIAERKLKDGNEG